MIGPACVGRICVCVHHDCHSLARELSSAWVLRPSFCRCAVRLVRLAEGVGLGADTGGGRAGLGEVAAKGGGEERSEDDLGATEYGQQGAQCYCVAGDLPEDGQREPQEENKLEDKVEGEPVDDVNEALRDGEEGEDNPVLHT